jgi:hypothetical protein
MPLTLEDWTTERAKLVGAQADIQSVIDAVDQSFAPPSGFAVWDRVGVAGSPVYSNGDLTVAATGVHALRSTVSFAASKRYFEAVITARGSAGYLAVGVMRSDQSLSSPPTSLAAVPSGMWLWRSDAYKANNGASSTYGSAWNTGDTIMVYWNESGSLWFGRNGTWNGDPNGGTGPAFSGLTGTLGAALVFMGSNGSPIATGNFASPLYTPPTGALLLEVA